MGTFAIAFVTDITARKRLEEQLMHAQKMEAVGQLPAGIAHDFNNVLTAIIGFSDLLLQTHKPGNPSYAHILSVKSSANRAAGLVRQLLAFSRRQTLQPKVLQLGDVLTDWSMLLNRLLGSEFSLWFSDSGEQLSRAVQETRIDLVLLDILLPGERCVMNECSKPAM